jgi:radical SAM protein with 4Fe4S-binding SPASM domain
MNTLSLKESYKMLSQVKELFTNTNIILTGGEPTLHNNFHEILEKSLTLFSHVSINTNATTDYLLSLNFLELAKKFKINIQISIDGDHLYHDSIRGEGSFEKSLKIIEKLDSLNNISLVIATTVTSKKFIKSFKSLHGKLKIFNIRWDIKRVSYSGRATDISESYLSNHDWNEVVDYVMKFNCNKINIFKTFDFEFLDLLNDETKSNLKDKVVKNCGSGTHKIYIYPNLDVLACTCYESFPSGNLKLNSLKDVLSSKNHNFIINQKIDNAICNKCDYKDFCNGGCLGSGFSMLNKHNIPDVKCPKIYEGV